MIIVTTDIPVRFVAYGLGGAPALACEWDEVAELAAELRRVAAELERHTVPGPVRERLPVANTLPRTGTGKRLGRPPGNKNKRKGRTP